MCVVVKDYFTELFAGNVENAGTSQVTGYKMVTRDQNLKLIEEFSFEEFTAAVK